MKPKILELLEQLDASISSCLMETNYKLCRVKELTFNVADAPDLELARLVLQDIIDKCRLMMNHAVITQEAINIELRSMKQ